MKKIKNPYAEFESQGYNCFACCPSNPFGLKMVMILFVFGIHM